MRIEKWLMAVFVVAVFMVAVSAMALAEDNSTTDTNTTNQTENETVELNTTDLNTTEINQTINETVNETNENQTVENETTENETDDNEILDNVTVVDDNEISILNSTHGMEMRLLQLQKRVIQQENLGQFIVDDIHNKSFNVDTTKLETYVDQMNALSDKIAAELAKDPVTTTTEEFVALKEEAITITFNFRKELYNILTPEQMNIIKKDIRNNFHGKDPRIDALEPKIKNAIRGFNSESALRLMNKFGINDSNLRTRIESGNFTAKELKDGFKADFKQFKAERKAQIQQRIKTEAEDNRLQREGVMAERMGLNATEVHNILNDDSLTMQEKQAKLRLLAKENGIKGNGQKMGPFARTNGSDNVTPEDGKNGKNPEDGNGRGMGRR